MYKKSIWPVWSIKWNSCKIRPQNLFSKNKQTIVQFLHKTDREGPQRRRVIKINESDMGDFRLKIRLWCGFGRKRFKSLMEVGRHKHKSNEDTPGRSSKRRQRVRGSHWTLWGVGVKLGLERSSRKRRTKHPIKRRRSGGCKPQDLSNPNPGKQSLIRESEIS